MSLAQNLRHAAQHDDWRGYVCPVMNKVLTAYLVPGVDVPPAPTEQLRTYLLVVAEALDGGGAAGVPASRVDDLLELARQYAHAYFNHHTGSQDGMLAKTQARLRAALSTPSPTAQEPNQ